MTQTARTGQYTQQDRNALLVFRVGNSNFCTSASSVVSIIEPPPINKLPLTPASFAGIIDYYESATPIICLRKYFNEFTDYRQGKGVIIIAKTGTGYSGYWVDETVDMISMESTDFHERDPVFTDTLVTQFVTNGNQLLLYVDLENLYKEVTGKCSIVDSLPPGDTYNSNASSLSDEVFTDEQVAHVDSKEPSPINTATTKSQHEKSTSYIAEHNECKNSETKPANNYDDIHQQDENLAGATGNTSETHIPQSTAETTKPEIDVPGSHESVAKHEVAGTLTGWAFKKCRGNESLKGTMTPYILLNSISHNVDATYTDTLSEPIEDLDAKKLPVTGERQPPGINPSKNTKHKIIGGWSALLIAILFLLTLPIWWQTDKNQHADGQQKPVTENRVTKNNTGSITESVNTVSGTSNTTTADNRPDKQQSTRTTAKQSDTENQYRVILGLQSETYSITVERPENNIQQDTGTSVLNNLQRRPASAQNTFTDEHPLINNDMAAGQAITQSSGQSLTLTETPVASARQPVFKGKNNNWNAAQYEEFIYVVVKGDTLWDIAAKFLGDPFKYKLLSELSYVRDPDWIYPGDIVRIRKMIQSKTLQ